MLKKYHPIWINTQFNHPNEITVQSTRACDILQSAGIPIGNQSVLLKGINDDVDVMEKLLTSLIRIRVRPYYIYQCDYVKGTEHFMTYFSEGMAMIEELRHRVSGYAMPHFIIDVPGLDGGKIVAEKCNILDAKDGVLKIKGLKNNIIEYNLGGHLV